MLLREQKLAARQGSQSPRGLFSRACGASDRHERSENNPKVMKFKSHLRQLKTNFCLPDGSSFFVFLGIFEAKSR